MNKYITLKNILDSGVVAVIRAENKDEAVKISKACIEGGIKSIEVTYTVPGTNKVIEALKNEFGDVLEIGAGTVLDSETARIAILSGASYVVSPGFDEATAKLCNRDSRSCLSADRVCRKSDDHHFLWSQKFS